MAVIGVLDILMRCDSTAFAKGINSSTEDLNNLGKKLGVTKDQIASFSMGLKEGGIKSPLFATPQDKFDALIKKLRLSKSEIESVTKSMTAAGISQEKAIPLLSKVFESRLSAAPKGDVFSMLGSGLSGLVGKLAPVIAGFLAVGHVVSEVKNQLAEVSALNKLSSRLGITTNELIAMQMAWRKVGLEETSIAPTMTKLQQVISDTAAGTGSAGAAFRELGLNAQALNSMSPEQKFRAVIDALAQIPSQGDKIRVAMQLMGEQGGQIAQGLSGGSKVLDEMKAKAERLRLNVSPIDAKQIAQAKGAMGEFSQAFVGIWRQATIAVAPYLEAVFTKLTGWVTDPVVTDMLSGIFDGMAAGLHLVVNLMSTLEMVWFGVQGVLTGGLAIIVKAVDLIGYGITKVLNLLPGVKVQWGNTLADMSKDLFALSGQQFGKAANIATGENAADRMLREQKEKAAKGLKSPALDAIPTTRPLDELINKYRLEIETMGMSAKEAEAWRATHQTASGTAGTFAAALDRLANPREVALSTTTAQGQLAGLASSTGKAQTQLAQLEKQMIALEVRKSLNAENPYYKLTEDLARYTVALQQGAITQQEFDTKSSSAWNKLYSDITGKSLETPWTQYQQAIALATDALAKHRITQEQFNALQSGLQDRLRKDANEKKTSVLGFDANPLETYQAKLKELQGQIGKTITLQEYWQAAERAKNQILGVPQTAEQQVRDYQTRIEQLTQALSAGVISQEQFAAASRKAQQDMLGVPQTAEQQVRDYQTRIEQLRKALAAGVISQEQFAAASRKAQQDMLGVAETPTDKLASYRDEIGKLQAAYKAGAISAEQFANKMADLQQNKLGVGPSIAQQMSQWKSQIAMLQKSGIGGQQLTDALKNSAPDFIKNLYDQTRTPVEKYLETVNQLKQWRANGMNEDLYNRGMLQAKQQLGVGEFKLASASEFGTTQARNDILAWRMQGQKNDPSVTLVDYSKQQLDQQKEQTGELKNLNKAFSNPKVFSIN